MVGRGADTTTVAEPSITELFSLRGRVALITGGAKGLGQSIAFGFAQAGALVVLASRDGAACADSAAGIAASTGASVVGMSLDVTDEADVARVFAAVVEQFGALD